MKIFCRVNGKQAVIVGYGPGRKGRPRAIVIANGKIQDVALKDIELELPERNLAGAEHKLALFKRKGA
jgi:hypothetical protein